MLCRELGALAARRRPEAPPPPRLSCPWLLARAAVALAVGPAPALAAGAGDGGGGGGRARPAAAAGAPEGACGVAASGRVVTLAKTMSLVQSNFQTSRTGFPDAMDPANGSAARGGGRGERPSQAPALLQLTPRPRRSPPAGLAAAAASGGPAAGASRDARQGAGASAEEQPVPRAMPPGPVPAVVGAEGARIAGAGFPVLLQQAGARLRATSLVAAGRTGAVGTAALGITLAAIMLFLTVGCLALLSQPKAPAPSLLGGGPRQQQEQLRSAGSAAKLASEARGGAACEERHFLPPPARPSRGRSPSSRSPSPSPERVADSDRCLCPDLVVPPNCECILLVPTRSLEQGPVSVTDTHGNAVLSIEPRPVAAAGSSRMACRPVAACGGGDSSPEAGSPQAGARSQRLVLKTIYGDLLAQCGPAPARPSPPEFHLLRATGEHFAKLSCNAGRDRCTLTTRAGSRLHFWGSPANHALNVAHSSGKICATTEPQNLHYYKLRVAPLMDVGLVLCGVLCIDHLA